jgi:hypothetical protein
VLPSTVILGLMAIPYLDYNKKGSGYYTIAERPFAYINFQFGFFQLWIVLIILGTFLRGPNWAFFGPFEYWDPHKVVSENNVNLSEFFWDWGLGTGQPRAPEGSGFWVGLGFILYRESPGILLTVAYFAVLPPLLAATVFRKMYVKMGLFRYMLMVNLLLLEALLPIKMVLRWTVSLKYLIYIPEYFLNL